MVKFYVWVILIAVDVAKGVEYMNRGGGIERDGLGRGKGTV